MGHLLPMVDGVVEAQFSIEINSKPVPKLCAAHPRGRVAQMLELLRAGGTDADVARELGVTHAAVYQARKRWLPEEG